MKIVFFGTSTVGLPILDALTQHHDIALVVTSPDALVGRKQILTPSPIATFAVEHSIAVAKPEKVKHNIALLHQLQQIGADIFVVVSYGKILPLEIINLPPLKTLNVHFSLLPQYRGASPIQGALLNGDTNTGTSLFILEEKMDTGPIVAQEKMSIAPEDTFRSLAQKLTAISADLLLTTLPKYEAGTITPQPQNEADATYVSLITKEDGRISWTQNAETIYNRFRAFIEWPGIWTTWNGKKLKIIDCKPGPMQSGEPGTVAQELVHCENDTTLRLITVQLEGKTMVSMEQFLHGYPQFSDGKLS